MFRTNQEIAGYARARRSRSGARRSRFGARRGATAVLAMLFLVILSSLALAMFAMATTNVQAARNFSERSPASVTTVFIQCCKRLNGCSDIRREGERGKG